MPELIYKKAGAIELIRYRDAKRFLSTGVVQSIVPTVTNNEHELEDGNSDWMLTYSAGKAGGITVNLNSFVPHLYSALVSMEQELGSFDTFRKIDKYTVPAASPYTIDLGKTPVTDTLVVHDIADSPLIANSTPAQGQYKLNGQSVEFNSADAGKVVITAFDYETSGEKSSLAEQTNNDIFRAIIAGQAVLKDDEGTVKADTLIVDRVTPTGEIARPPRQKAPAGWNFTLKVLPPRPGYKVIDYFVES